MTVKGVANPDLAAVEAAAEQLSVHGIDDVRGNLTLPTEGANGVGVAWASSEASVIDASGIVHRPTTGAASAQVELTATLTKGEASVTKTFAATVPALPAQVEPEAYLFGYFTGDSLAGEKIYFGASNGNNAQDWLTLNGGQPVLSSTQGTTGLRDPFIIRSPEGDKFYMIATDLSIGGGTSWDASQRSGSKYIEVWESTDLVNWTDQRHVKVSPDTAGNTWAPEAYYDESIGAYVVFWASKLYAESDPNHTGNTYNRMLFATTRDFRTFSAPQVWQDTGVSRIDSTVIKVGDTYHRFTKDEASVTGCLDILEEASTDLRAVTTTTSPTGAWALKDTCIGKDAGTGAVEGPSVFAANPGDVNGPGYYLFVDEFSGRKYIPLASDELGANADWKIPSSYQLPSPAPRHGTVLPISTEEYQRVLDAYLPDATGAETARVTTQVGTEATLPSKVAVTFADGSSRSMAVTWEAPPVGYADQPGEVQVQGAIAGLSLTATLVIRVISATGDLRLHYDFSLVDGTRVPDSSPYANDGVIRGTGATVSGNVLTLPGGSSSSGAGYVQLPTGMFDGQNTLTISTWLKNETAAGNYAAMFFGSAQNPPSQYWLLNPRNPQGRFKSVVTNGLNSGAPWGTEYGISPTTAANGVAGPLTSSDWGLYTTVIEPGKITGYLNGQLIGSVPTTRTVSQFGSNLVAYLGKSSYPDAFYKGGIRDVKVYTTARTAAEIAGEYFAGVNDPAAVLAALEADAAALDLGPNPIAADLDLPALGEHGSAIAWTSSDAQVIAPDGTVNRPATDDASVTLTATLALAGQTTHPRVRLHGARRHPAEEPRPRRAALRARHHPRRRRPRAAHRHRRRGDRLVVVGARGGRPRRCGSPAGRAAPGDAHRRVHPPRAHIDAHVRGYGARRGTGSRRRLHPLGRHRAHRRTAPRGIRRGDRLHRAQQRTWGALPHAGSREVRCADALPPPRRLVRPRRDRERSRLAHLRLRLGRPHRVHQRTVRALHDVDPLGRARSRRLRQRHRRIPPDVCKYGRRSRL